MNFEWDDRKEKENAYKHGVSFYLAQYAFADPKRDIAEGILTVRFTYRARVIRIFGAGYWRKGKAIYEKENKILK